MVPTIIRHKTTTTGFILVVTTLDNGLTARVQEYRTHPEGRTHLQSESVWSSEQAAILEFDKLGEQS